jgi:hypothetical protein
MNEFQFVLYGCRDAYRKLSYNESETLQHLNVLAIQNKHEYLEQSLTDPLNQEPLVELLNQFRGRTIRLTFSEAITNYCPLMTLTKLRLIGVRV